MPKQFIRRDVKRYSKLGKNRKKLQKWRRPKGRDNKMRENRFGYPKTVKIGYKTDKKTTGTIDNMQPVLIHNTNELDNVQKNNIIIVAKVGAKKKLAIIKKATEKNITIANMNKETQTHAAR